MTRFSDTHTPSWKHSYTAAIFQDDVSKIPTLVARAESEIVARARVLFEASGDNMPEIHALDNALRMLQVLKKCIDSPPLGEQNSALTGRQLTALPF